MSFWAGFEKKSQSHPCNLLVESATVGSPNTDCHKTASEQREKIRSDIKTYENEKKKRKLYGAGRAGALGIAALGGFKKNPALIASGIGGAFGAGLLRGKSAKEEQAALNRIKRHYDLREHGKLINLGAVIPGTEKAAAIIDIADLLGQIARSVPAVGHGMSLASSWIGSHMPTLSAGLGAVTGTAVGRVAVDVAAAPGLGHIAANKLQSIAHIAAKKSLGTPLTSKETKSLAFADWAKGISQANKEFLPSLYSEAHNPKNNALTRALYSVRHKINKPAAAQYFNAIPSGLFGTASTGKRFGEIAGEGLNQVRKISPEYADLGLKAMAPGLGKAQLATRINKDVGELSKAFTTFSNDTFVGRLVKRKGETSGSNILQRYARDPNQANKDVAQLQKLESSIGSAGKALALAAGTGIAGSLVGEYRGRHPLARDELPTLIAKR